MQASRFVLTWLGFMAVALGQYHYAKKDVLFAQVVVGGGFETVINLTNRGTSAYVGALTFFRLDNTVWSPFVNRSSRSSGEYEIEIRAGETVTLRLTGSQLESGAAVLLSDNLRLDNLIEANLTYLIRNEGQISDSVGIAPSNEFHRASIPFEQFAETGLALAHGDTSGEAKVDLTLYSAAGGKLGTEAVRLGPRSHRARFLHEFFPEQTLERGRVEISSEVPIFGTALTLAGGGILQSSPGADFHQLLGSTGDRGPLRHRRTRPVGGGLVSSWLSGDLSVGR